MSDDAPTVTTSSGRVAGIRTDHDLRFLGVPYAAAPFGAHRLAAPVPPPSWDGVRPAERYAPTAPQPAQGFTLIPEPVIDGGDAPECLSLNVFTPELGSAGLPVLVWVHGGGFQTGTPSSPWYDGRSFARDGVVVVSVGYRLGAEGFLHVPGAPDNRGVLDWLAALEWVQDNIAGFGGDPSRVTVAGQSAGGIAVCTLLGLQRAAGLFRRAIAMSGSVMPTSTPERMAAIGGAVARHLGVDHTRDALAAVPPAALVAAQDAGPAAAASEGEGGPAGAHPVADRMLHRPFADGEVVPVAPIDAMAAGATDHVDLLLGATAEEFNAMGMGLELDDDALAGKLRGLGLSEDAARACIESSTTPNGTTYGQALTDTAFRTAAVRVCEARAGVAASTFHYDFRFGAGLGSIHCSDLPFAWDLLDAEQVEIVAGEHPPVALAETMHGAWVDFVAAGDPGWRPYDTATRTTMVFDEESAPVDDALAVERGRWL